MSTRLRNIIFAIIGGIAILVITLYVTPLADKIGVKLPQFSSFLDFSASDSGVYYPKVKMLENGLEVIVVENDRAPIVNHMLWMRVGSADEQQGKTGLAHFLEHLIFGPTKNNKRGWYEEFITSIGGQFNAFTSYDFTAYFMNTSKENLKEVMEAEAERMKNLVFDQEFFDSEKLVVLEEQRTRYANNPGQKFYHQLTPFLFQSHPYARFSIGLKRDIQNLELSDAQDFFDKWYAPNNAYLIISGDVKAEDVFAMAEEIYGGWQKKDVPKRKRSLPEPLQSNAHIIYEDEHQSQDEIYYYFQVPSEAQDPQTALALHMIADLISDKSSSLAQKFIVKDKSAIAVGAHYSSYAEDTVDFELFLDLANGQDIDKVAKSFYQAFQEFVRTGIDKKDFEEAKTHYIDSALFARDSLMQPGYAFGVARTTGQSIESVESWDQQLKNISLEKVNEVLKTYFLDTHYVSGYLRPKRQSSNIQENKQGQEK